MRTSTKTLYTLFSEMFYSLIFYLFRSLDDEHSKPVTHQVYMMSKGEAIMSDWTERYRPKSASELEGNDAARKRISIWLESWKNGMPD